MLGLTSKTRPSWTVEGLEGLSCWLWGPEHVTVRGTCAALRRGSPGGHREPVVRVGAHLCQHADAGVTAFWRRESWQETSRGQDCGRTGEGPCPSHA